MLKGKTQLEIKGQVERITYYNEENGYTIAKVKVQGRVGLVTIVGNIVSLIPGEVLKLQGFWDNHPRYGEQFKVVSYESVMPATVKGIEKYLGSGMIKGIGRTQGHPIILLSRKYFIKNHLYNINGLKTMSFS